MTARTSSCLASLLHPLYQFIYPPTCLVCEVHLNEKEELVCGTCLSGIRRLSPDDDLYQGKLGELTARGHIAGLASVFHFERDGILQSLIHQLKYQEMTSVGVTLGKAVGESLRPMLGDVALSGVVPIPLHPLKERERGYNQSEFITEGISSVTHCKVLSRLLQRTRHTKTQAKLDAEERRENVADAFAVNARFASLVPHSSFLLVDDLITTGATVEECARVLKAGGAEKIYAASIAIPDHTHLP